MEIYYHETGELELQRSGAKYGMSMLDSTNIASAPRV